MPPINDIFRHRAPYQRFSRTSRVAADSAAHRPTKLSIILEVIREAGDQGVTQEEIVRRTGFLTQTVCARVNELEHKLRLIEKRGRTRRTSSGRPAEVYVLARRSAA